MDSARDTINPVNNYLIPNLNNASAGGVARVDFLSNGFKVRAVGAVTPNASGITYMYFAIAETPFNYANAR